MKFELLKPLSQPLILYLEDSKSIYIHKKNSQVVIFAFINNLCRLIRVFSNLYSTCFMASKTRFYVLHFPRSLQLVSENFSLEGYMGVSSKSGLKSTRQIYQSWKQN